MLNYTLNNVDLSIHIPEVPKCSLRVSALRESGLVTWEISYFYTEQEES